MNLVKVEKLVQYLIGPSYVLNEPDESLRILREAVLRLEPPERALIRNYYLGETTLAATLSAKSKYVYLHYARRSLAAALTTSQKEMLKNLCIGILDLSYAIPETWTKTLLAEKWFPFHPDRMQRINHLISLAAKAGIVRENKNGFTPEEANCLAELLVERRERKWPSKQRET